MPLTYAPYPNVIWPMAPVGPTPSWGPVPSAWARPNDTFVSRPAPVPAPVSAAREEAGAAPDSFADAVGRQAGRLVTRVLQQNPDLQARLQTMGVDRLLADPERTADEIRQNVQRSWMTRQVLQRFGDPLVRILPQSLEPAGYEALRWLQQPAFSGHKP